MKKLLGLISAGAVFAMVAGCGQSVKYCTEELRSSIGITVYDSLTGHKLDICDITYQKTNISGDVTIITEPFMGGCGESNVIIDFSQETGVFDIRIDKSGFETWHKSGVVVNNTSDGCHPVPVSLDAVLVARN